MQSFLRVSVAPFPQISRFRSLHRLSSNNSENTNHRHLPLTRTNHCNSRLLKIFTFKETITQNYNFFSKSKVPIFKSNFGWILCFLSCLSFLHAKTVHVCRLLHRQVGFFQYCFTQESNQMNIGCQSN